MEEKYGKTRKELMGKFFKKVLRFLVPKVILRIRERAKLNVNHIIKQNTIREYQQKFGYRILVETGTFFGDMVEAQKKRFDKIISIELGVYLFERALKRFNKDNNVTIIQGDSGKVLPKILKDINEPVIFWLDGHYSGGITKKGDKNCPIFEELDAIFNGKKFNHVLLIDDARCFTGVDGFPSLAELTRYVKSKSRNYQIEIKDDILRCTIINLNCN
jgi:hypothetical protein